MAEPNRRQLVASGAIVSAAAALPGAAFSETRPKKDPNP
jgi:hypothetical protein